MKKTLIAVLLLVTGVAVGTAGVFLWPRVVALQPGGVVCTADAMQCPDGSYVGRTGPRCAFAPCPGGGAVPPPPVTNAPPAGWQTKRDTVNGITFSYPEDLGTTYMRTDGWPPTVTVSAASNPMTAYCATPTRQVNGRAYCVTERVGGAAGTAYDEMSYITYRDGVSIQIQLTVRAVGCANFEDPQATACRQERHTFDLDALIDRIAQTIQYNS